MSDRPVILLAAHGERGGASKNARLAQIVEEVGRAIPEADVGSILVNVEGVVAKALDACAERPVLCLPLIDRAGQVFAVTQLLNRRDGRPFDEADERRYADFAASLSVLLESLARIDAGERRATA